MLLLKSLLIFAVVGFPIVLASGAGVRLLVLFAVTALAAGAVMYISGLHIVLPALMLSVFFVFGCLLTGFAGGHFARTLAGAAMFVVALIAALPVLLLSVSITFPDTEGDHDVGARTFLLIDGTRGESWDTVDEMPRRFLVRAWYPADVGDEPVLQRASEEERRVNTLFGPAGVNPLVLLSESLDRVSTHAHDGPKVKNGAYPLLIFSHGYSGSVFSNAMLMEQLASQGYIVVSISHPGESAAMVLPDGTQVPKSPMVAEMFAEHATTGLMDAFFLPDVDRYDWGLQKFEPIEMVSGRLPVWAKDFSSVLDALQSDEHGPDVDELIGAMDFEHIGFLGMSAGGGSSTLACHEDRRCDAVVSLDGGIGVPAMRNTKIRVPALVMDGGYPSRLGGQDLYFELHAAFGSSPDVLRVTFPANGHADFTDAALSLSALGKAVLPPVLLVHGPVDGHATLLAQSRLTTAFFNQYLKDGDPQHLDSVVDAEPLVIRVDPEPMRRWVGSGERRR